MAKELPYFKFEVSEWMFGRIQKRTPQAQAAFINLCCKYWHKLGQVTLRSAQMDFGLDDITELVEAEIITTKGENVCIKFLDEQLSEFKSFSQKQSKKGKSSAQKRKGKGGNHGSTTVEPVFNHGSTSVQPQVNLKEEEIIEDKKIEELPHLERFFNTSADFEQMVKYSKSIGIKYHEERFKLYVESFDAKFTIDHEDGDYKKWKTHLGYFFQDGKHKAVKIPYEHQERVIYR